MFSLGIQLYSIIYIYIIYIVYNIDRETERVTPPKITHLTLPLFSDSDFTFPSFLGDVKKTTSPNHDEKNPDFPSGSRQWPGLGLLFAFSQPVTKSMPPAVADSREERRKGMKMDEVASGKRLHSC